MIFRISGGSERKGKPELSFVALMVRAADSPCLFCSILFCEAPCAARFNILATSMMFPDFWLFNASCLSDIALLLLTSNVIERIIHRDNRLNIDQEALPTENSMEIHWKLQILERRR